MDKVYLYITDKQYADRTSENTKRIIWKKAAKFAVIDGEIYSTKKREKGDIKLGTSEAQRSSYSYLSLSY